MNRDGRRTRLSIGTVRLSLLCVSLVVFLSFLMMGGAHPTPKAEVAAEAAPTVSTQNMIHQQNEPARQTLMTVPSMSLGVQ